MNKEKIKKDSLQKEIELLEGISAEAIGKFLTVKGQKGEVKRAIKQKGILLKIENKKILLKSQGSTKKDKKLLNSLEAHIKNMIKGSSQNHTYMLKICSGHFPMNVSVQNNKIIVKNFLGEKVPRVLKLKEGANVKVEGDLIHVTSADKETAGQMSADIEQLTRRPGYDTRIFQDGCYIIVKDGKELK